jgi:hypothetical protein
MFAWQCEVKRADKAPCHAVGGCKSFEAAIFELRQPAYRPDPDIARCGFQN